MSNTNRLKNIVILSILIAVMAGAWLLWPGSNVFAQPDVPHPTGGNEECSTCHEAGENGAPKYPDDHDGRGDDTCLMCHAEYTGTLPTGIPHPTENRDDCLACHQTGVAGAPAVPSDHAGRTSEMCQVCHKSAIGNVPLIPHTVEGRENCVACHVAAAVDERVDVVLPTPTPLPTPAPLDYPEQVGDDDNCASCHLGLPGRLGEAAQGWQAGIHAERGVICADCHGGDPNATTPELAMSEEAGYIGKPDRTQIPELCGGCHSNVSLMRQYDLPTDQLAKYRESFHGQQLANGDIKVATCYDCHGGHATRQVDDPSASVYPLNVPGLCASCHSDRDYMAEYDIPTDQFQLYETSVHGVALLDHQDTRSPSCATCHGTHGAAPPGFGEVANVCGSCHGATQDYFLEGNHSSDNPDAPRCVTCHGRYDVSVPTEELFVGTDERHCGECHAAESDIGQVVNALYLTLSEADEALEDAEAAVAEAAELGMIVSQHENLLNDARTRLITARAAQHNVDLETVKEETEASIDLSNQALELADSDINASRVRRLAMGIALGVIVLIIVSLVLLRRELLSGKH